MKKLILLWIFILCSITLMVGQHDPMDKETWTNISPINPDTITVGMHDGLHNMVAAFSRNHKRNTQNGTLTPTPQSTVDSASMIINFNTQGDTIHFYIYDVDSVKVYPAKQALVYDSEGAYDIINYFDDSEPVIGDGAEGTPLILTKSDKPIVIVESNGAVCPNDMGTASLYIFGRGTSYTYNEEVGTEGINENGDTISTIMSIEIPDLQPDTLYEITVTVDETADNKVTRDVTIEKLAAPSFMNTPLGYSYTCGGKGTLVVNATGDVQEYSYSFSSIPDGNDADFFTQQIDNLNKFTFESINIPDGGGSYEVTVTNGDGCSVKDTININPLMPFSFSIDEPLADDIAQIVGDSISITCEGLVSIPLDLNGGIPPYQYKIDEGSFIQLSDPWIIDDIGGAFNEITITDSCFLELITIDVIDNTLSFSLHEEASNGPEINSDTISLSCFGDSTTVFLSPSGGISDDYLFTMNGNDLNIGDQDVSLSQGAYNITLMNGNCSKSRQIIVTQPSELGIAANVTNACGGGNTGAIQIDVTGGTMPYIFEWDYNETDFSDNEDIIGLMPGNYAIKVTDDRGCIFENSSYNITAVQTLTQNGNPNNPTCDGASDGGITVNPGGGTPPYSYTLISENNDTISSGFVTDIIGGDLTNGNYDLIIRDSSNCKSEVLYELNAAPLAAPQITMPPYTPCPGESITVIANHDVPDVQYTWTYDGLSYGMNNEALEIENVEEDTIFDCVAHFANCSSAPSLVIVETAKFPLPDIQIITEDSPIPYDDVNFDVGERYATCFYFIDSYNENDTYYWEFGDGGWSDQPQPCHYFNTPNVYPVYMEVITEDGCVFEFDSIKIATVTERPEREGIFTTEDESIFAAVFPNPFIDKLTLMLDTEITGQWDVVFTNSLNQHISATQIHVDESTKLIPLDFSDLHLPNGLYILHISNSDRYQNLKVIKNAP